MVALRAAVFYLFKILDKEALFAPSPSPVNGGLTTKIAADLEMFIAKISCFSVNQYKFIENLRCLSGRSDADGVPSS